MSKRDDAQHAIPPTLLPREPATRSLGEGGIDLPPHLLNKLRIEIPGYDLLDEISRGGQATVYRARERTSGLTVAIKLLHSGPHADAASRQRLHREIAALKALNHPNIVCVIESGQTGTGLDYLVLNYVDGKPLDAFWKDRKLAAKAHEDSATLLRLFQRICETVASAHRKGITHRDLSPSNILVDDQGEPHVLDFGLASTAFDSYLTPGGSNISLTGQFLGKLAYASPEQARGSHGQIDIRTDVYALGVILYQILTNGSFPYEVVGNLVDVLNNIIHSKPTPPSAAVSPTTRASSTNLKQRIDSTKVNATIEAIVLKALEKSADDRYQSAGELAREIEQYLRGRPTGAVAVVKSIVPVKQSRRRRLIWIGATSSVLVLGALMFSRTIVAWLGFASFAGAATSQPTSQPAEAPGRIEFKTIELASTETSIDAINKKLKLAGYAVVVASNHASDYQQSNIGMDRNGGGPVDWRSFYGKTVRDFSSTNAFGNRQTYRRPPQFDYIYQANNQQKAKLEKDVDGMGKQIDTLLTRRRTLENNQTALWATIAWQAVDDRGIALEPINRFKPQTSASDTIATARLGVFTAASTFLVTINAALEAGLENVAGDPAKTLADLNDRTKGAYGDFRTAMADASASLTSDDDQKAAAQLSDTAKHLFDLTRNAVDAQKLAIERDEAKDDQGKNTFRGQLQAAVFDTCSAACSIDDQLNAEAKAWNLAPNRGAPIAPASIAIAKGTDNGVATASGGATGGNPSSASSLVTRFGLTVGSKWAGTSVNSENIVRKITAEITSADGDTFVLRSSGGRVTGERTFQASADGTLRYVSGKTISGDPVFTAVSLDMTGKIAGDTLVFHSKSTLASKNGSQKPNEVVETLKRTSAAPDAAR